MKIVIFDTETTGIPSQNVGLDEQPYICQFASVLYEVDLTQDLWTETSRINQLIKPPISIPLSCTEVHGILDETVAGAPSFGDFADRILEEMHQADVAIAHNIAFDEMMLKIELERLGRGSDFMPEQVFDTMKETRDFCRLPGNHGRFKSPRLSELHLILFEEDFDNAHDALADVLATARCAKELMRKGIFKPQEAVQDSLF